MKTTICAAAVCFLVASLHARADLVYVEKVEVAGKVKTSTSKIKGDKVRTDSPQEAGPSGGVSTIMDIPSGDVITLNHDAKTFTKQSEKKMAARKEAAPAELPQLTDTGKKEKVAGYNAEIYTAEIPGVKFTVWVTKDFPDGAAVSEQMKKLLVRESEWNHSPDLSKVEGVVVKSEITLKLGPPSGSTLTRTLISAQIRPVDDVDFQIPKDYTEVAPKPLPTPQSP